MNTKLRAFAIEAGVEVVPNGPGWGGRWGYRTADCPGCMVCGFKTRAEAYEHWLTDTFGAKTAAALKKLLEKS